MLIYLKLKGLLIRTKKTFKIIGFSSGIVIIISMAILIFNLIVDNTHNNIIILFTFYASISIFILSSISINLKIKAEDKKVLVLYLKTRDSNTNLLIDEIVKCCRKRRSYITIKNWSIYNELTIIYEEIIDEPIVFDPLDRDKINELVIYPMDVMVPHIYLKEFLINLVEKKGLSTTLLEKLLIDIL